MKSVTALEKRARSMINALARKSALDNEIDRSLVRNLSERYLRSHDVKMLHVHRRYPKIGFNDARRKADWLDPFATDARPIDYYEVPRAGRTPRLICSLPDSAKIIHRMAKNVIEAQFTPHPANYDWKGRGRDRLVIDLRDQLANVPEAWVLMVDVRDCFSSIRPDALYELNILPDAFVEAALDVRQKRFRRKVRMADHVDQRRTTGNTQVSYPVVTCRELPGLRGLMQGSPTSNVLLAKLFDDLPSQLSRRVTPRVIADNIIVVCWSRDQCSRVRDILDDYFSRHRAGPLVLQTDFMGQARQGFDCLGYSFLWEEGRLRVTHSAKNLVKSLRRVARDYEGEHTIDELLNAIVSGFNVIDDDAIARIVSILDEVL